MRLQSFLDLVQSESFMEYTRMEIKYESEGETYCIMRTGEEVGEVILEDRDGETETVTPDSAEELQEEIEAHRDV